MRLATEFNHLFCSIIRSSNTQIVRPLFDAISGAYRRLWLFRQEFCPVSLPLFVFIFLFLALSCFQLRLWCSCPALSFVFLSDQTLLCYRHDECSIGRRLSNPDKI